MERIYGKLTGAGVMSLVLGIVTVLLGTAAGVLGIINGAGLLAARRDLSK